MVTWSIMVIWWSGYIAMLLKIHVTLPRLWFNPWPSTYFLYYNNNNSKHCIPSESVGICWNLTGIWEFHPYSNRFQWNPTESIWYVLSVGIPWNVDGIPMDSNGNHFRRLLEAPRFQPFPVDSVGFHRNLSGMENQNC
jgi:hypothetical protein